MTPNEMRCELQTLQAVNRKLVSELTESQQKLARSEQLIDHLLERLRARGINVPPEVV